MPDSIGSLKAQDPYGQSTDLFQTVWADRSIGGWPNVRIIIFYGVFPYKSSSMLNNLNIGWALVYGWMTRLSLLHK